MLDGTLITKEMLESLIQETGKEVDISKVTDKHEIYLVIEDGLSAIVNLGDEVLNIYLEYEHYKYNRDGTEKDYNFLESGE